MAIKNIEIVADEVTILKQIGELIDPITGRSLGIQQGAGKVYLKGEKVPVTEVSPLMLEALDDEDNPLHEATKRRIRYAGSGDAASENLALRLGLPFEGYDELDEDQILAVLPNLPSSAAQAVKTYEASNQNRERIVGYSIGFGQSPSDRQEGRLGSQLDEEGRDEADKAVADLTTREVPEEGVVQVGEGITGTGDPDIPHGSTKAAEEGDGSESKPTAAARRRGRRTRAQAKTADEGGSEGGSDDE